jgi:membrane protein YqaA with SNARE-associated domain
MADHIALDAAHAQGSRQRWMRAIALSWGFAEATVFFVVPDVWISLVAVRSLRQGLWTCAFALAGALAGGIVVYLLGLRHQAALLAWYDHLPAISRGLIVQVSGQLQSLGATGVVLGGFTGAPYKLYAAQAASAGMDLPLFLAASVLARGSRFVLVAMVVGLVARALAARLGNRTAHRAVLVFWLLFYAWYWSRMPN